MTPRRPLRWRALAAALLAALAIALLLPAERPAPEVGSWLRAAGLAPRFETIGGVRIRYVRAGSGDPVVLLHGLASSIYTWKDVIGPLAAEHDVIALDLPGFGGSDPPAAPAWSSFPSAVTGLLDRQGVPRASLVGSSLGGAVAVLIAARDPGRVERLALLDSAGFDLAPPDRPEVVRLLGSDLAPLLARLPLRRALTRLALRQIFFDPARVTDERVDEYVAPFLRPGALESMRALLRSPAPSEAEFERLARSVHASTLVLWGREDRWIPVAQADLFARAIPGARKVVLERCGHLPQEERPLETAARLRAFLERGAP